MISGDKSPEEQAHEVCRQMAAMRRELDNDVEHVTQSARAMTDWTFYVRRFPWAAVGLAAAAGYMLVPRRKITVAPTPEQLAGLATSKKFAAAATSQLKPPVGLLGGLTATIATMAARAAIGYVTEQLRDAAAKAAARQSRPVATAGKAPREMGS